MAVQTPVEYEQMRDEYVLCRTVSHAWEEYADDEVERPAERGWWWFIIKCYRCETRRYDLVDSNGEVFSRKYKYPDGYELDEKVTRIEMRQEWAARAHYDGFIAKRTKRYART